MATHYNIFAWRIPWTEESGWATVHRVTKSQTQLSDLAAAVGEFEDRDHLCFVHGILPNRAATL